MQRLWKTIIQSIFFENGQNSNGESTIQLTLSNELAFILSRPITGTRHCTRVSATCGTEFTFFFFSEGLKLNWTVVDILIRVLQCKLSSNV